MSKTVIGIDFGTLSGRAVVVAVADGQVLGSAEHAYRHGVIDRELAGQPLPPDWALQVPADYVEVLGKVVPAALADSGVDPSSVVGLAIDFTSCTVFPTDVDYEPLCEKPEFRERPHAYVKLWKHHASQAQGRIVNRVLAERAPETLARYGGEVSADWQLAKALALFQEDREVWDATAHFVEAGDWIVQRLTGKLTSATSLAGYKGNFVDGAHPAPAVLETMAPGFSRLLEVLPKPTARPGDKVGELTTKAAELTGLPAGIAVATANIDAHATVPAANACEPGQLTLIMGTSTCHMMTSESFGEVPGIGGIVPDGIVKGLWGYEAGQAGVGDIFGWFVNTCVPKAYTEAATARGLGVHEYLTELAAAQQVGQHGLLALDWHSGNRSILDDTELTGLMVGTTLTTTPEDQYRALLEATAFGTRVIIEAFQEAGVEVGDLVIAGGLVKNPLLMQIYADVTNLPLAICESVASGAHGSAIYAAVAAGEYPDVRDAAPRMARREATPETTFTPIPENVAAYNALYREYRTLHDYFGTGGNEVMHRLKARRREILIAKASS